MKKIFINLILLLILLFYFNYNLATLGIETNKFNKLISDKASQTKNINLDLETINLKLIQKN